MEDSAKAFSMSAQGLMNSATDGAVLSPVAESQSSVVDAESSLSLGAASGILRRIDRTLLRPKAYERVKRLNDIVFSLGFMLFCGIWLFPLIAIAIKLDSPGPVFFRQERVGWKGMKCL